MTHPEEVPTLTLPREDMMRLVMAFRAGAGLLRRVREMQGSLSFRRRRARRAPRSDCAVQRTAEDDAGRR